MTFPFTEKMHKFWFLPIWNEIRSEETIFFNVNKEIFLVLNILCSFYICRLAELGIEARSGFKSHGEGSTQLLGSIQLSSKESFFGKAEAKTIVEINAISEVMILCRF